jgi:hypothetical protein
MAEKLLEAEAVEEPLTAGEAEAEAADVRRLPESRRGTDLAAAGDVRTAALVAAGGIVAGAATVVAVRALGAGATRGSRVPRLRRRQERPLNVIASRSFLVDVHLLDR